MNRKIIIALSILAIAVVITALLFMNRTTRLTSVYVDPPTVEKTIGQSFTVNLNVSDVANLYAWEVKLAYDSTILEHVNTVQGSFLGNSDVTFFTYKVNDTSGYVLIDCTLLGNLPGVNGTGTVAIIEFHVKQSGSCDLKLYDTKLLDPAEQSIEHSSSSGHFSSAS
jgi:hypothetical protein